MEGSSRTMLATARPSCYSYLESLEVNLVGFGEFPPELEVFCRGVAMGGYISIYTPKISLPYKFLLAVLFTCGTLTCFDFEIGMTS